EALDGDARVKSLAPLTAAEKMTASAYHQVANARGTTRINIVFHDDVTFDDAVAAIAAAGGAPVDPLTIDFMYPRRVEARVPAGAVVTLAHDERVLSIHGRLPKIAVDNRIAGQLSQVDVIQDAPYNLNGEGVVMSLFELGAFDPTHVEYSGRFTSH